VSDSPDDDDARPHAGEQQVEYLDSRSGSATGSMVDRSSRSDAAAGPGTTDGADEAVVRGRGRRRGLVAGAVLAVALAAGGVAYGVGELSGGGAQPDEVLPASALGIVSLDLDPSAGEKVDALRFARRFPALTSRVGGGDDLREMLFDAVSDSAGVKGSWADVEPWLGDRAALAVLPAADELDDPVPVVVLAVTDEGKARAALPKVLPDASCQVTDGFAVCADDGAAVKRAVADAAKKSLADDPTYSRDIDALGGRGIAAAWFDLGRLKNAAPDLLSGMGGVTGSLAGSTSADLTGRYVAAVRFDGPHLELAGHVEGAGLPRLTGSADAGSLPQNTLVAVGLGDAGRVVTSAWSRLEDAATAMGGADGFHDEVSSVESTYGITLPDDVVAAVGDQLTVAVGPGGTPQLAVRLSGAPDSVQKLLGAVQRASGSTPATATSGGATVIATDQSYATAVAQEKGLSATDLFQDAVKGSDGAQSVVFVDVAGLLSSYGPQLDLDAAAMENVEPLAALGVSVRSRGDGLDFRVRLVTR
jgi:hypothetical protein